MNKATWRRRQAVPVGEEGPPGPIEAGTGTGLPPERLGEHNPQTPQLQTCSLKNWEKIRISYLSLSRQHGIWLQSPGKLAHRQHTQPVLGTLYSNFVRLLNSFRHMSCEGCT